MLLLVIPATTRAGARASSEAGPKGERQDGASQAGLRRQDARANMRAADGPEGMRQKSRVIRFALSNEIKMDSGFRATRGPGMTTYFFCLQIDSKEYRCNSA